MAQQIERVRRLKKPSVGNASTAPQRPGGAVVVGGQNLDMLGAVGLSPLLPRS